jgi:hypothetical protein
MNRTLIAAVALATALAAPGVAGAHEGHLHKVMGTVTSVDGNHVTIKATDGKTVMVMLDKKTIVTRGKTTLDVTAVRIGERVVAEGPEAKKVVTAKTIRLGDVPAVAASK